MLILPLRIILGIMPSELSVKYKSDPSPTQWRFSFFFLPFVLQKTYPEVNLYSGDRLSEEII